MTIEVLAPVGNMDMFYAALSGGADAVFLAAKSFGARAYANNFDIEEIREIVRLARARKVRVHVTVNTLIKEDEMEEALDLIRDLIRVGVDAIIVQDLGLLNLASKCFDNVEFHCSTQLSANSSLAVNFLQDLGASRVILARELSYKQVENICNNTDMDIEVFGHGSLCVSYSGKCTMSSYIGARSGNRGRCAQPCRKEYELLNPSLEVLGKGFYLSPKDLASRHGAIKLQDLGLKSIKIEGRMKKPDYVYGASKYYKDLLRGLDPDEFLINEVSNRGFTQGILGGDKAKAFTDFSGDRDRGTLVGIVMGKKAKSIKLYEDIRARDGLEIQLRNKKYTLTVDRPYKKGQDVDLSKFPDALEGSEVYRISNASLRDRDYGGDIRPMSMPMEAYLYAHVGEKPYYEIKTQLGTYKYSHGQPVEKGERLVLDYESAFKQLSKLKDTDFFLDKLTLDTDGESFLPVSILNEMRRKSHEGLFEKLVESDCKLPTLDQDLSQPKSRAISARKWNDRYLDYEWDEIYLSEIDDLPKLDKRVYYELPMVIRDEDYDFLRTLIQDKKDLLDGLVLANAWDIEFAKEFSGLEIILSEYANILNSWAAKLMKDLGADRLVLSNELSLKDIEGIRKVLPMTLSLYSRPIEMIMDHCPASVMGCDFACETCRYSQGHYIRSPEGDTYKMSRVNKQTRLQNILPIDGRIYKKKLEDLGIRSFLYRIDDCKDLDILSSGRSLQDFRTGHLEKGVL